MNLFLGIICLFISITILVLGLKTKKNTAIYLGIFFLITDVLSLYVTTKSVSVVIILFLVACVYGIALFKSKFLETKK